MSSDKWFVLGAAILVTPFLVLLGAGVIWLARNDPRELLTVAVIFVWASALGFCFSRGDQRDRPRCAPTMTNPRTEAARSLFEIMVASSRRLGVVPLAADVRGVL